MNWRDLDRTDLIRVVMVSPTDLSTEWGELDGVDLGGCSISTAYYSDTRENGKARVYGEGWKRGSFIRIYHDIPEWGYSEPLGTFIVTDQSSHLEKGEWMHDLTLQSVLKGLATEKLPRPWVISRNASLKKAIAQNLAAASRPWHDLGSNDAVMKSPAVIESGTSRLSALFSLANAAGDRLDVDPMGFVTLEPYTVPSAKASVFEFSLDDPQGIMEDGLDLSTDWLEMPDEVIVAHKYSETANGKTVQREIDAVAKVPSDSHQSKAVRGYTVSDFRALSDMSPKTAKRAQDLAESYLKRDLAEMVEWDMRCRYLPLRGGSVVDLIVPSGDYAGRRKCLVKSTTLKLDTMALDLTLKETASGDDE